MGSLKSTVAERLLDMPVARDHLKVLGDSIAKPQLGHHLLRRVRHAVESPIACPPKRELFIQTMTKTQLRPQLRLMPLISLGMTRHNQQQRQKPRRQHQGLPYTGAHLTFFDDAVRVIGSWSIEDNDIGRVPQQVHPEYADPLHIQPGACSQVI